MREAISLWIVSAAGWAVLSCAALWALYWSMDRALRIVGLLPLVLEAYRAVLAKHGWAEELCPRWWHWAAGNLRNNREAPHG